MYDFFVHSFGRVEGLNPSLSTSFLFHSQPIRRGVFVKKKRKYTKGSRNEERRKRERGENARAAKGKRKDRQAFQDTKVELRDPGDLCVSRVWQLDTQMMIEK